MNQITTMETEEITEEFTEEEIIQYKQELRNYYLACLWMEGSKIILFLIIFGYLHLLKEFFIALLMLMFLRNNGGGIHCKHYISCFAVSFLVLALGIWIPQYIHLPQPLSVILLLLCSLLGYQLVPIVSESRPEPDGKLIKRSKRITLLIILAYCIVICICPENSYLQIGSWTVYIHIIQLLIAKFRKGGHSYEFTD